MVYKFNYELFLFFFKYTVFAEMVIYCICRYQKRLITYFISVIPNMSMLFAFEKFEKKV